MLMDGDLFVKKRIPISTLEYNSIEAPSRSNGICNLKIIFALNLLLIML